MRRAELAEKLISARSESERKLLLDENKKLADARLALALKEICYKFWTTAPTKTQLAANALKSLYKINPADEIKAHLFWVSGIADLTKGKLEKAIENLDRAAEKFLSNGKERESADTRVAKLIALAMLGRYDEALKTGETARAAFVRLGEQLAAGKIEMNLGNMLSRRGFPARSEKFFLSARKRFTALGETIWLTMCENNLAIIYSSLNDFRRAEKFYDSALRNARSAKMFVTEAEIEASMGNLALFRGRFNDALKFLEQSRQKFETLAMPHQTATAELEIADIYLELNLAKEAVSIYEKVAERLRKLKLQGEEARARANFARAAIILKDARTAKSQLQKSARLYTREKNPIGAAAVKIAEANLERERGNFSGAKELARKAEDFLAASENLQHRLTARWIQAEAARNLGKFEDAEKNLREIAARSKRFEQPRITLAALNSLGKLFLQTAQTGAAENYFKRAARLVETLRAPLAAEEFRMSFLADKLAPFENLARIYLKRKKLEKALQMIEKARSRVLAENLDGAFSAASSKKAASKLEAKILSLREELNWFYSRLNRAEAPEIEALQREAKRREKEIADVQRKIESTNDARKTPSGALDVRKLQARLGSRKALIEYVCFEGFYTAFVVTKNKIFYFENLAAETEIIALLEGLRFQFGALRYGAENLGGFLPELKKRADFYLKKLYAKLFAPLETACSDLDLVIVPVGALHYVPFHAARDASGRYLIESRKIVYAPGAAVWQKLSEKPKREKSQNALLIGFADEKIPLVDREIEALQEIFPDAKSFTGNRATYTAYNDNAADFGILHLACHGQFRPENPLFSSLHLADGWVTVRDICSHRLRARLVTLSACETGLNKIFAGDEILGLARGFLSAGARNLVLSLWTVSDEATTELMKQFYANLQRGASVSASLKIVQNNFIKSGAHPYFWSPFAVIGK